MKLLSKLALLALLGVAAPAVSVSSARADGCYLCGSGSTDACKNYCRYSGSDTFDARKICEKRGCKVSGTGSCPTAVNYKVCMSPVAPSPNQTTVATAPIQWCAAPVSSS